MRRIIPLALIALSGCAAEPPHYAVGRNIRGAEHEAEVCRAEVSASSYGGRPINIVTPPSVLTRPGIRAVTINVAAGPGTAPQGWHCLFNAQGALMSVAPGDAQARGDYLY
ncbi:hypothetical protein [Roseiterribacter gracilis]|uniref:Lipoprotein n=1 Tax=Roseiterribacter gracilis TaxID=2812848 RepID=A0A8S8XEE5_9PROT|nr:hypothetical protein TMPK1_24980 [Rhodospirillales bacterium TMPK1]